MLRTLSGGRGQCRSAGFGKRDKAAPVLVPQGQFHAADALPQRQPADISKFRVVANDFIKPVERDARAQVMDMMGADVACEPAQYRGQIVVRASMERRIMDIPVSLAFQIGFLIFIPFLIIDLVVASVLMSMGMMMLSPMLISLPFKILLFVMVDGWSLLIGTLASSFFT